MQVTRDTGKEFHKLQEILGELDEEYNALDLISETLENAFHQLKQEESILRQTLSQASCDVINRSRTSNNSNNKSEIWKRNKSIVNDKKTKDAIENEALKRLESALFDSDGDDSNSDNDTKRPKNSTNSISLTKNEDLNYRKSTESNESDEGASKKEGSSVSVLNDDSSSGSEIDEDELLKL